MGVWLYDLTNAAELLIPRIIISSVEAWQVKGVGIQVASSVSPFERPASNSFNHSQRLCNH